LTFSFLISSMKSSCHCCLGFSTGLVPIGHHFTLHSSFSKYPTGYTWLRFHSKIFFRNWVSSPMSNTHPGEPEIVYFSKICRENLSFIKLWQE
jgi:hypothetical protein